MDLLILDNGTLYPVEVKKSAEPSKDAIKNFDVVSSLGHNVGKGAVICMTPMPIPLDKDNLLVPLGAI